MYLAQLSDDELLRHAHAEISDLTSTPLEIELLRRLERHIDVSSEAAQVKVLMEDHGLTFPGLRDLADALILNADNTVKLLQAVHAEGYDSPDALIADLKLAETFASLATDAGDVFARLSSLTETATAE